MTLHRIAAVFVIVAATAACGSDATGSDPARAMTITSAGGTVTSADGRVTLVFPPGAVTTPVRVEIAPAELPADARLVPASAYHFEPSGTQFSKPVQLTIRHGPLPAALASHKAFVWVHKWANGGWIPIPGSAPDTVAGVVRGELSSFSNYGAVVSDLTAKIQYLRSALDLLVNTPIPNHAIDFLSGLRELFQQQQHPLFDVLVKPVTSAMFITACGAYKNAVNHAAAAVVADYHELTDLLDPVTAWAAVAEALQPGACQASVPIDGILTQKLLEFTNFYLARLAQPDFTTDFKQLINEVHLLFALYRDAANLEMDALGARLLAEGQMPLLDKLRISAYDACRNKGEHEHLGALRSSIQLFDSEYVPYVLSDILQDLQFCATRLGWRLMESDGTQKGQGTLGGGPTPGAVSRIASATGVRSGALELSQDVRAFRCADSTFAPDELILTFAGVEVRRLQASANGHFFASPVTIPAAELLSAAGVDPDAAGTHRFEVARSSSGCGVYVESITDSVPLASIDLIYPADAESLDLTGTWALVVDKFCTGDISVVQQGTSLTVSGSIGGLFCPYNASGSGTGTLNGSSISFGIALGSASGGGSGGSGSVKFDGVVTSSDSMSGTHSGGGSWSATRK